MHSSSIIYPPQNVPFGKHIGIFDRSLLIPQLPKSEGLYDFAAIARWRGDIERADYYSERAEALLDATVRRLVHSQHPSFVSHFNTVNAQAFVDGSTVEMLAWELIDTSDELFGGTLNYFEERLLTEFGGYKRLEQQLSLTGESQATRAI